MYAKETVSALPANSGHCAIWRKITRRPSGQWWFDLCSSATNRVRKSAATAVMTFKPSY